MSNMRQMKMRREDLLKALASNREQHRATFLKAQEGYRKAVIKELDQMLAGARVGKLHKIRRGVTWPEPTDHTADYDHAIRMLEMCVDDEIEITADDFERLVMDEWGWKGTWTDTTSNYID